MTDYVELRYMWIEIYGKNTGQMCVICQKEKDRNRSFQLVNICQVERNRRIGGITLNQYFK
jgi:hypothetical protein